MNPAYLKIESIAPPKQGGQHVGMVSVGVRVTHIPTGIEAACKTERSQHKNRNVALAMIEYGLLELGWKE